MLVLILFAGSVYSQQKVDDSIIERIQKNLELTKEQSGELQTILQNAGNEANHIRELNRRDPEAIKAAMADLRERTNQQIENILTPEQLKKYQEMKSNLQFFREARDNRLEELQKRLNLSDEQVSKIEPIMAAAREKMQELRQNSSGDRQEMRSGMQAIFQERDQKIKEILTDAQKAEYDKYLQEQREQMRQQRGQRPGGKRPN